MVDGQNREMLRLSADHTEPNAKSFDTPWHTASLLRATWTVGLQAPPVSPLDDPMQRAFLMLGTLAATVGVAYWGGCIAARRLIHAMASLTQAVAVPRPSQDIDEIAQVRTELRRLARRREALREAEQRRIGLELHDDLQQKLALLRHEVDGLSQEAQARGDLPSADTAQRLERARGLVDETIESTRRLVQDLCPPILQDLGLPMALRVLAERHQAAHGQRVDLRVLSPLGWAGIPEETATVLYRVAQEALNNVRKHSGAHTVDMTLEREGDRAIVLEVCDDGVGYQASDLDPATTGNGLRSMRERVQALSGQIEWVSQPAEGCAILVRLPLNGELPAPSAEPAGDR
jgi:signal transduction histidine kinase